MITDLKINREWENAGLGLPGMTFLYDLVKKVKPTKILEVGFAEGMSSLAILKALSENENGGHLTSIDPFQKHCWRDVGNSNVANNNFSENHTLLETYSCYALPELLKNGEKFDFIFIDGSHLSDDLFVDQYFASKLLKIGGHLLHDDYPSTPERLLQYPWMQGIKDACDFLEHNYCFIKVDEFKFHRFSPLYKKIGEDKRVSD